MDALASHCIFAIVVMSIKSKGIRKELSWLNNLCRDGCSRILSIDLYGFGMDYKNDY